MPPSPRPNRPYRRLPLLVSGMAAVLLLGSGAHASSQKDIEDLLAMIKATGTEVVFSDCKEDELGGYTFSEKPKIDRLTVCKNTVDVTDHDALWEVLAHEATHIMQACNGGHVVKEEYHPRLLRRLKAQAPHYAAVLEEKYRGREMMLEAEAFDMELQEPDYVKDWLYTFCLDSNASRDSSNDRQP